MTDLIIDLIDNDITRYLYATYFIINSKEFSCYNGKTFKTSEIEEAVSLILSNNKKVIINIDKIFHDNEIKKIEIFINKYIDRCSYFIFSDMVIFNILKKINAVDKLIYDSKTIIASTQDLECYSKLGVKCIVANELSKEEINKMNVPFIFEAFGYHQIFYSYRKLLSMYKDFDNIKKRLSNKLLFLKEELRDELYLVYESNNGTFIYTPYIYMAFEELNNFIDRIDMIKINCMFLEQNYVIDILEMYFNLINKKEINKEVISSKYLISRGFLDNKSILLKGDTNE